MNATRLATAALATLLAVATAEAAPIHVPRATAVAALGLQEEGAFARSRLPALPIGAFAPFATLGQRTLDLFGRTIVFRSIQDDAAAASFGPVRSLRVSI